MLKTVDVVRISAWIEQLNFSAEHHDRMMHDIDSLLKADRTNVRAYGEQTETALHTLQGQHWSDFMKSIASVFEEILSRFNPEMSTSEMSLRSWASRFTGRQLSGCWRESARRLHNHSPALLSAVYYLKLPEESERFGTMLINPYPHAMVQSSTGVIVKPAVGRLVVFPSWLLHEPVVDATSDDERIVIAIDAHVVPL